MRTALLTALFFIGNLAMAQVGIGTNSPSGNAALDVSSVNKGIMLPRIDDTSLVSSPSAGLMIYNKASNAPAFHNGTQWSTLATLNATTTAASTDSITYTISNAAAGFMNGVFRAISIGSVASNPNSAGNQNLGPSSFSDLVFVKPMDINSTNFSKAVATGLLQGSMVIEFKVFTKGAVTPYYSIKVTTMVVTSFNISLGGASEGFVEQISVNPTIFGYKNWVNNTSFSWNQVTRVAGVY
jgi:type VI protein secretion system component Hcp